MIETQWIDGLLLREMILAGTANLEKNREMVDALNVFPVPDGDTGTNMSLTMKSAAREVSSKEYATAGAAAAAIAKGALRGARGNSGVITSQLMRGFARAVEGLDKISPLQFAQALKAGADKAYKAVMKPKEGTILTVARVIAEEAVKQAQSAPDDFDALMRVIMTSGENILSRTPDMLPVLKQAGVVDAGGRGLMCIYAGYVSAMGGEYTDEKPAEAAEEQKAEFVDDHDAIEEFKYAYCTKFEIRNLRNDAKPSDITTFRRYLNRIGDNVLVDGDQTFLNVHVHTNDPGKALQYGLSLGELMELK
ncbi:MAG: DAK2 domain-containing protein, partial [Clostridia bacterium]|nr:DAK2 domain-containing protein [Clostridia bacterium]